MHILVVDPNQAFATLLSEELKRQGYDVYTGYSSAEALAAARKRLPDLAVLDMALNDPDALTLVGQLRALDANMRLMLIPLMGEDLPPAASALSIQGVLPKPFFLPELPAIIEAALRGGSSAPAPAELSGMDSLPKIESGAHLDFGDLTFEPITGPIEPPLMPFATPPQPEPAPAKPAAKPVEKPAERPAEKPVRTAPPPAAPAVSAPPAAKPAPHTEPPAAEGAMFNIGPEIPKDGLSGTTLQSVRAKVQRVMDTLAQEVGADLVLLTLGEALAAWVGQLSEANAQSVARSVIYSWRASAEVARILGRKPSRFEQSTVGADYMIYALSVESNAIMVVAIRGSATLGLLRHRARETADAIAKLCR